MLLEHRYRLQEFPALSILGFLLHCQVPDKWIRAVRQVHELLELLTQSELDDTDCTGDVEEYCFQQMQEFSTKFALYA